MNCYKNVIVCLLGILHSSRFTSLAALCCCCCCCLCCRCGRKIVHCSRAQQQLSQSHAEARVAGGVSSPVGCAPSAGKTRSLFPVFIIFFLTTPLPVYYNFYTQHIKKHNAFETGFFFIVLYFCTRLCYNCYCNRIL